ncbi:hypothetical protein Poly51_29370 [Rubripirellula tenax]|uniref:DNA ligase D 3'-phosphoesterase domain-containing protein n=1 Tax=Rubripirellula tenax TaxID=2528015 RepID=A0A5C6FA11_9BACT|nr:hypothetical protein [Rubripirellula tenax]TWU57016.1 hypothetical protein Poly51_29370 [Rubripirellula tenax]
MNHTIPNSLRFAVLHHRIGSAFQRIPYDHFDWMFEDGDSLTTWSSPVIADWSSDFGVTCDQLPPHRKEYIDYEGPISNDRGEVSRVLGGTYLAIDRSADRFAARLIVDPKRSVHPLAMTDGEVIFQRMVDESGRDDVLKLAGWSMVCLRGRYDTN